jgi:hypothetical protein
VPASPDPALPVDPLVEPVDPADPPELDEPDEPEVDGIEDDGAPPLEELDEGDCEPPVLPPPEDDDGEDDEEPPDDEGMPLGIELDVVVLQPASATAAVASRKTGSPCVRCM